MRTIKFRGKSKIDIKFPRLNEPLVRKGEWVYGSLVVEKDFKHPFHYLIRTITRRGLEYVLVEEETIGQYTGIVDFYGKEIYEGDVVKKVGGTFQGTITWNSRGYYYIKEFCYYKDNEEPDCTPMGEMIKRGFEVIGNIHDNPKFLEDVK